MAGQDDAFPAGWDAPAAGEGDPEGQQEAARLAVRRALQTWQLVRHGQAPARALADLLTPPLCARLADHSPIAARIAGVRVQLATDRVAHAAAVVCDAAGQAHAVVVELRRDGEGLPWRVTQLSPVESPQLVDHATPETSECRTVSRRLPADLTEALAAARRARDEAAAQAHASRGWRDRLTQLDHEIAELEAAQQARDIRRAIQGGHA